jgi:hypothetical protein
MKRAKIYAGLLVGAFAAGLAFGSLLTDGALASTGGMPAAAALTAQTY